MESKIETEPIEGFFVKTVDDLLFDVKGLSHPEDRIISFVRYVPKRYFKKTKKVHRKNYCKLYNLKERYEFLQENYPKYLFEDPMGRGLLQAVPRNTITEVFNPIERLHQIIKTNNEKLDSLEQLAGEFAYTLLRDCKLNPNSLGVSGSIMVNLHEKKSDIDLVVYGKEDGIKTYHGMNRLFEQQNNICRYTENELKKLWKDRGQNSQIDFESFLISEQNKQLQGTINDADFYIRLVLQPEEYNEPYLETKITSFGDLEIEATIENDEYSIFTPCIYHLSQVQIINSEIDEKNIPDRIFSVRGRYCDIAKTGEQIKANGKLERVKIANQKEYYQLTLGTSENELLKKIYG